MNPMKSLAALGAATVLMGSTAIAAPAGATETNVQDELAKDGGTIEMVVAGESKTFEISSSKNETQKKVPVPYCGYKGSSQAHVKTYTRAGLKDLGGHTAYLRCGSYGKDGWGLRHIGERHKSDWASKAGGKDWFAMMEFATKATLKHPQSAIRQANDTHNYCAPVQLKYNGKTYDTFKTTVPVTHVGKNVITSAPVKKCK